jgi:CubicO group peptidase (beta-lactamase class C family)
MKSSYLIILAASIFVAETGLRAQPGSARITGDVVPGTTWQRTSPESVGYSSAKLEALRAWLKTQDTAAMVIVIQGRIVFSYGDLSQATKIASARKSVLAMLYGNYVASGKIDLTKTVKQLGLDDKQPFLPIEEGATLEQLLAARSGVYLPNGSFGQNDYMPHRGSEAPGTHYVYNNWDFDAAGLAFEKQAGRDIYDALRTDLAVPLGMEDYDPGKQKKEYTPDSLHAEYVMRLSARDMARLGLLMLDNGRWNGQQIIPADWVRRTTTLVTPFRDINPTPLRNYADLGRWGYGLLWWVWDAPHNPGGVVNGPFQDAYTAAGAGGTYITVFPGWDTVVVHRVDIDANPKAMVTPSSYMAMLSMLANSYCGDHCK